MLKQHYPWITALALGSLVLVGLALLHPSAVQAQQFPMVDQLANKIVQKYQSSTCEQLWEKKASGESGLGQSRRFECAANTSAPPQ
jgi:hypothetical protein